MTIVIAMLFDAFNDCFVDTNTKLLKHNLVPTVVKSYAYIAAFPVPPVGVGQTVMGRHVGKRE